MVPRSVAALIDGDGGELVIPSTWRESIQVSDAETETVDVTTKNQRCVCTRADNLKKEKEKNIRIPGKLLSLSLSV